MAREVKIKFGGAERLLWFDARDGIAIRDKLGKKPAVALREDIVLLRTEDGKPLIKAEDVDLYTLAVFLQRAISHMGATKEHDPKITLDVTIDWLSEYIETSPIIPLAFAVQDAAHLSGMLGNPYDIQAAEKKAAEDDAAGKPQPEGDPTGKAAPSPSTEIPTT